MAAYIGTSGWSYDHWVGVLYPRKASSLGRLDSYARDFRTVEVNNTFYRWPKDEVFTTWHDRLQEGFVASAKASRGLTQFRSNGRAHGDIRSHPDRTTRPARGGGVRKDRRKAAAPGSKPRRVPRPYTSGSFPRE